MATDWAVKSVSEIFLSSPEGEGDAQVQVSSHRLQVSVHCADGATGLVLGLWGSETGEGSFCPAEI
jgi:hypothetical protein